MYGNVITYSKCSVHCFCDSSQGFTISVITYLDTNIFNSLTGLSDLSTLRKANLFIGGRKLSFYFYDEGFVTSKYECSHSYDY